MTQCSAKRSHPGAGERSADNYKEMVATTRISDDDGDKDDALMLTQV